MKAFFLATQLFWFKNGAALIFANFLGIFCQQGSSSSRNRRNCMYAGGSPPLQPTTAAQLLLNGGKIEPYTIIIMVDCLAIGLRAMIMWSFS
jgi:hypothetical protein